MHRVASVILVGSCAAGAVAQPDTERVSRIDAALARASAFLIEHQAADGSWRSETYGLMRDGATLTPPAASALFHMPQGGPAARDSFVRATGFLMSLVRPDGAIGVDGRPLEQPVYAASGSSWTIILAGRTPEARRVQDALVSYLRELQYGAQLGWQPGDPDYGGWGYATFAVRRPDGDLAGGRYEGANLSATLFAIGALRLAQTPADDPIYDDVLCFVQRCQNYGDDPAAADPAFDDGGFFFSPTDPARNKAGPAGVDAHGRTRFHSYGSMTADGLRALVRCGLPLEHPRVRAARSWLERNFRVDCNPGVFERDREVLRDAYYYYYCWSVAHALLGIGAGEVRTAEGERDWAAELAEELMRRQNLDGSWTNRFTDAREDDPLVATPLAGAALAVCRRALTGENPTVLGR